MQIVVKSLTAKAIEENDYCDEYTIIVDGKTRISVRDGGEPEDNFLCRDLNFVYSILPLIVEAYNAGKAGEEFSVEQLKTDLDE